MANEAYWTQLFRRELFETPSEPYCADRMRRICQEETLQWCNSASADLESLRSPPTCVLRRDHVSRLCWKI